MNNNNSTGVSYTTGFFLLLGLSLSFTVIIALLSTQFLGNEEAFSDPANAPMMGLIQAIAVLLGMFLPAWLVAAMLDRRPNRLLGFQKSITLKQVVLVMVIMVASVYFAGALGVLNKAIPISESWRIRFDNLEKKYAEQVEMMVNLKSFGGYLLSILLMAFLPALCEEALFRGGLQNFLSRGSRSPWLAIIIVSILFSIVHFSFYGFLPRLFLGIILGLVYYLTNNLWLSILAHFFNNALAVSVAYVFYQQGRPMTEVMNEDLSTSYWGLLMLPVLVLLLRSLKRSSSEDQHPVTD